MILLQVVAHEAKPLPSETMVTETQGHKGHSNRGVEGAMKCFRWPDLEVAYITSSHMPLIMTKWCHFW